MKQADSIPTRRKLIQQSAALAATVPAALALPSMVAQAAEPDPIFDLIEAHKDAFLKWGGPCRRRATSTKNLPANIARNWRKPRPMTPKTKPGGTSRKHELNP
jgi:hypothetical protein